VPLPIVILTSCEEQQGVVADCSFGANSDVREPVEFVDFFEFVEAVKVLGLHWLALNPIPPRQAAAVGLSSCRTFC